MKRKYSLKRNKDFRSTYRRGEYFGSHYLVLAAAANNSNSTKIGLCVSKKIGNSVARNRVKRRLRECIRPLIQMIKPGHNLIFIARLPIVDADFLIIQKSVHKLLNKAGLFIGANQ